MDWNRTQCSTWMVQCISTVRLCCTHKRGWLAAERLPFFCALFSTSNDHALMEKNVNKAIVFVFSLFFLHKVTSAQGNFALGAAFGRQCLTYCAGVVVCWCGGSERVAYWWEEVVCVIWLLPRILRMRHSLKRSSIMPPASTVQKHCISRLN